MPKPQKHYVVWKGRHPGIYDSWDSCKRQVDGYVGALYKAFPTRAAAESAYAGPASNFVRPFSGQAPFTPKPSAELLKKLGECYAVDAACSGNPGRLEYRCVHVPSGRQIFHQSFPEGTNNIGEFLAIVETLVLFKQKAITDPVYSDSKIALAWLKVKKCKTQLPETSRNHALFERVHQAEAWLKANTYATRVLHWKTDDWGENPADFGRK